jgi:hypothetical protein
MTCAKNEAIKACWHQTKARRRHQTCRVFTVKLDRSKLNQQTRHHLKMLFLEAKWWYNHILAQPNVFEVDDKVAAVPVKVKDTSNFEIDGLEIKIYEPSDSGLNKPSIGTVSYLSFLGGWSGGPSNEGGDTVIPTSEAILIRLPAGSGGTIATVPNPFD